MNEFARWRELIAAARKQKRGNPYVPYEPDGADVLAMMDEIERLKLPMDWAALQCRFGCTDPVVGIYHAPHGCICWPDPVQALCAQHAIKGLQNNDMSVLIRRP